MPFLGIKNPFSRRAPRAAAGRSGYRPTPEDSDFDKKLVLGLSRRRLPTARQFKHLFRFLSPKERLATMLLLALIALGLILAAVKFVSDHIRLEPTYGGTYIEALVGSPRLINPILAVNNDVDRDICRLVFSGLMKLDSRGRLMPDLAESYEISDDGKIYTFKLKSGVVWHDGAAFSSQDVVSTVGYIKNPSWKSPYYGQFKNVSAESTDDLTVKFTLKDAHSPFLAALTVGIMPDHLWQGIDPRNAHLADLNTKPVGTGPFMFKGLVKDKHGAVRSYTLTRNYSYFGARPFLNAITLKFYQDFAEAADAVEHKRADGLAFVPAEERDLITKTRAVKIHPLRIGEYVAVFFNQSKNEALKSKAVRQALAMAIDRDKIVDEAAPDGSIPAYGPIPAGTAAFRSDGKRISLDAANAARLLDEEGWKLGDDGMRYKESTDEKTKAITKTPLAVKLTTADMEENGAVAKLVEAAWSALGVKVETVSVRASRIQADVVTTRDYETLLFGIIPGPDPDPFPFWHSSQATAPGLNLSGFSSRRADELLEKARQTHDDDERAGYYKDFQDILADECPAAFLYSPSYSYAVSRKIHGLETSLIHGPADRFTGVGGWYINTKRVWK
jgi:peptide/nickel transport system substrate-binding protein